MISIDGNEQKVVSLTLMGYTVLMGAIPKIR